MYSAPDAELERLLTRLTSDIQNTLQTLLGLYLHGSLVTGDFDRDRSDIDLLAVLSEDVTEEDLARLLELHTRLVEDYPTWNDRIEVDYVSTLALTSFRTQPRRMARISPGEPLHVLEANRHYLLNWHMARQGGVALFGPPPQEVMPEISQAEFLEGVREHANAWGEWVNDMHPPREQAYAVLTLCRALYTSVHGAQVSKKRAARSVKPLLPQWSALIDWALAWWYEGGMQTGEGEKFAEVVRFVEEVRARVSGLAVLDIRVMDVAESENQ